MKKEIPKRLIIIALFLVISSLITIASLVLNAAQPNDTLQLPSYLAWYNAEAQTVMGIMSNSLFIVLSILMLLAKNMARIIFNYFNSITYIFSVLLAVTTNYNIPMSGDGPDMNELMNSFSAKGAIATLTTIFFVIIMWGVNSEKSRKFFRGSDESLDLKPSEDEVALAQAEREKEASEFES